LPQEKTIPTHFKQSNDGSSFKYNIGMMHLSASLNLLPFHHIWPRVSNETFPSYSNVFHLNKIFYVVNEEDLILSPKFMTGESFASWRVY
jgi:hypothetical protein